MTKLTKRFVETILPDPQKVSVFWDSELKGFGVVVLPSGRRTYCVQYRNLERVKKRFKIGLHGHITTEEARDLAKKYLSNIIHGKDPAEDKKEERTLPSIRDLAHDYLERHAFRKRAKSLSEDKRLLNLLLSEFGDKKIIHVTRRDIETFHLQQGKFPYQANRLLALLSKMFSLAVGWRWRTDNPVKGIEKYPEEKRDRWLDEKELGQLWHVLDQYPTHLTAILFKILLLTGARKGELLQATWDQFNFEQGIWIKPSHLTKQKKKEYLPLSESALSLLQDLKKLNTTHSSYLFPGRVLGKPIQETKTFWKTVLKKAGLENVRIHDLRHTHASHLVSSGLSLSIVGKLLGHTQASTTQRYAHLADAPLRQAAELFGNKVTALMDKERINSP